MKKAFAIILAVVMALSVTCYGANADSKENAEATSLISEFVLPKPKAPVYLMYDAADRTAVESDDTLYVIRQTDMSVLALASEYEADSEAFYKKYGLYSFTIIMQYDTSLDGTDSWNYNEDWDTDYNAPTPHEACPIAWIGSEMMDKETVFDLYKCESGGEEYGKMADAIIQRDVPDGDHTFNNFYFDHENHSLYIRVRYYMEWETYDGENIGERQSKYSEWSDAAIFGKNGNNITPDAPAYYEAPIISDLKYVQPDEGNDLGHLTYMQSTPEQVWNAGIYYEMTDNGYFDGLETQISINGGKWQEYNTANSGGDWCLLNGKRTAHGEEPRIETGSNIKLRIRFLGTEGPSEWSNVLEINGGGINEITEATGGMPDNAPANEKDKCSVCGFCPVPFGLCIFIWFVIILAVILLAVIIIVAVKPEKCKNCGEKLKKGEKHCPKCGTERK